MTLVVDASALVLAAAGTSHTAVALRARFVGEDCHAPHLIDAELGNVLRRQALRGEISATAAESVLREAPHLIDHRYTQTGVLASVAWKLQQNLTFYDALYVALAGALDAPLVTLDRRLASVAGLACAVELIATER